MANAEGPEGVRGLAEADIPHPVDAGGLQGALRRLTELYADRALWTQMVKRAMKAEVGWAEPAARYAALYRSLMK